MQKNHILYSSSIPHIFTVKAAKDAYLFDEKGNKYIDFTAGWNVANLGWNRQDISDFVIEGLKKDNNQYVPIWCDSEIQVNYASALVKSLPDSLNCVIKTTSGTESNEAAIKVARAYTKREKMLAFHGSYYGNSIAIMALGHGYLFPDLHTDIPGFERLDFPDKSGDEQEQKNILDKFRKTLEDKLKNEDIAGVLLEAGIITGFGSTRIAPKGFLKIVRELTKKYGTMMILDEVGTGFSRCGKLYGMELEDNVVPDLATFSKAMSNGTAPIGATVTTKEIGEAVFDRTGLVSTFAWAPLGCYAALKTLELHIQDKLWNTAADTGNYIMDSLRQAFADNDKVSRIDGIGMEIGFEISNDYITSSKQDTFLQDFIRQCNKNGVHLKMGTANNIQIMPPITIDKQDLDKGIDIMLNTLSTF